MSDAFEKWWAGNYDGKGFTKCYVPARAAWEAAERDMTEDRDGWKLMWEQSQGDVRCLLAQVAVLREALAQAGADLCVAYSTKLDGTPIATALASTEQAAASFIQRIQLTAQTNEAARWHQATAHLHRDDCPARNYARAPPACDCLKGAAARIRAEERERIAEWLDSSDAETIIQNAAFEATMAEVGCAARKLAKAVRAISDGDKGAMPAKKE